jgi:hypothetical protein
MAILKDQGVSFGAVQLVGKKSILVKSFSPQTQTAKSRGMNENLVKSNKKLAVFATHLKKNLNLQLTTEIKNLQAELLALYARVKALKAKLFIQ